MPDLKILLIDDHPLLRNGVAAVLGAQPGLSVVGEAGTGKQALEMLQHLTPDLCVVDLRMPGITGAEFMRLARQARPGLKFVVLTTYDGEDEVREAIDSGAQAFVLKGMASEQLVGAVRTVGAGGRYLPEAIEKRLAEHIAAGLTQREMDVLRLMAEGLNNREISARLSITEGTVKWNVNHILSKLEVKDRTQAVTAALRRGIVKFTPHP
jgi:DNA-binding NarL/FixJ family response regulator